MDSEQLSAMNRRINQRLAPVFREMERMNMEAEAAMAKANPRKHRLSTVMENGRLSYRHWGAVKDRRGRTIKFCWSSHRNVAGYFLAWREIETPTKRKGPAKPGDCLATITRDQWTARRTKKALVELQERRTNALRSKYPPAEPKTKTFWVSLHKDNASRGLGQVRAADEEKAAAKAKAKWGDREQDGWQLHLFRFGR
jgi:hypothetical protein